MTFAEIRQEVLESGNLTLGPLLLALVDVAEEADVFDRMVNPVQYLPLTQALDKLKETMDA